MNQLESAWQQFKNELEAVHKKSLTEARGTAARHVNQALRRMLQYSEETEWYPAVLDGAALFANSVAVIALDTKQWQVKAFRNFDVAFDTTIVLSSAAAVRNAIESREIIVTLCALNEVSDVFASTSHSDRAAILPICNRERVVALIFATLDDNTCMEALELVANCASLVLERRTPEPRHIQIGQQLNVAHNVASASTSFHEAPAKRTERSLPGWANLDEPQQQIHLRAQRFARVKTAEWQLFKSHVCQTGQAQKNLYMYLKSDIDAARDAYRKQFMTSPAMVDYLHLEMVKTLAKNEEMALGADYPGQMV